MVDQLAGQHYKSVKEWINESAKVFQNLLQSNQQTRVNYTDVLKSNILSIQITQYIISVRFHSSKPIV